MAANELMAASNPETRLRKKRYLTLEEKLKVLAEFELGKPACEVCKTFRIGKSQFYSILKNKQTLTAAMKDKTVPVRSKLYSNRVKYPAIDQAVFDWFSSIRCLVGNRKPLPISRSLLQARASYEAKLQGVSDFKASDGWFANWRWRFDIGKRVRLYGEASDVDLSKAEGEIQILRDTLSVKGYKPDCIFNMDETALFYKTIPNRTYLLSNEGDPRQARRGSKQMSAKDRITVILCVNSTGSFKIDPVIIGSAKRPRCFQDSPPCIPYFSQKNAWNDRECYGRWWNSVFLPQVRQFTKENVALLIDGFSGHDESCSDPLGQVAVYKFPPNVTSIYQPLDQGIIAAVKCGYKKKLLASLVNTASNFETLQCMSSKLPAGRAGLKYGCLPHMSDVAEIMKDTWTVLAPSIIAGCWRHAHCLPPQYEAETALSHDYNRKVEQATINAMCEQLSGLDLSQTNVSSMLNRLELTSVVKATKGMTTEILKKWLSVEEHIENVAVEEENEEEISPVVEIDQLESVSIKKTVLALLLEVHEKGAVLCDSYIMKLAREGSTYMQKEVAR